MLCSPVRIEVVKVVLTVSSRLFSIADVQDEMQRKGISCTSYTITTTLRVLWMKGYLTRPAHTSAAYSRGRPEVFYTGSPRLLAIHEDLLGLLQ